LDHTDEELKKGYHKVVCCFDQRSTAWS
jgi:hypothetical protein